jgi:hypothetical protein
MQLEVNGQAHTFEAQPEMPLLWVLRDRSPTDGPGRGAFRSGDARVRALPLRGFDRHGTCFQVARTYGHERSSRAPLSGIRIAL